MSTKPIRVLLIEDNRLEARLAQQWLTAAGDGAFQPELADRLSAALERLSRGDIDVVLSDLNLPDSRGLMTFLKVHAHAPDVPVVLLTSQDDEALAVQAVGQGAQDYLVKSKVDGREVTRVLRHALARHRAQAERLRLSRGGGSSRALAFLGAKGGVGTTTVALNVAVALARQRKSVVLAELRPSAGTLAFQLRQTPGATLRGLLDLPPGSLDEGELDARLCKGPAELRVLFGPQRVEEFREVEPPQAEAIVRGLSRMAEYVVLDLPPQPSAATQAAVRLSHFVALVTEREPSSLLAARVALGLLQSWGLGGGLVGAVVVTRMASATPMRMAEFRSQLGCDIVGVIPPATEACLRSQEAGAPLVLTQADNLAATSLTDLASRLAAEKIVPLKF